MALTEVKRVLTHAATDPEFRTKFFSQPDFVLSKYDLTEEEKQCLKELDEEPLEARIQVPVDAAQVVALRIVAEVGELQRLALLAAAALAAQLAGQNLLADNAQHV